MFGLLNIDKPAGMTSRDVVNQVQRLVKPHKAGHAGTLDPLATGVLVVAIGQATRLIEYVQRMSKTYLAKFLLGKSSDTEDIEGNVIEVASAAVPARQQIHDVVPQFLGTICQTPPAYSALKVGGQRAYELARRGQEVELAPRPVEIHVLEIVRYDYPELEMRVHCGSGTYIRSLGRDLARALGTEAVMSSLRREAIGVFSVQSAIAVDSLTLPSIEACLLSPAIAVSQMPQTVVSPAEQARLTRGQPIQNRWNLQADEAAALDEAGHLIAILQPRTGGLWPAKCFLHSTREGEAPAEP